MPSSKHNADELIRAAFRAAFDEMRAVSIPQIPKRWRTTPQWAAVLKVEDSHARKMINEMVENGLMEKKQFLVKTAKDIRGVNHYALKSEK